MSITDELRNHARLYEQHKRAHIEGIADRIDAAHEEALGSKVAMAISVGEDGTEFVFMPAKELSERYIELPKDADGEPIHIDDMIINPDLSNQKYRVAAITPESVYWWGEDGCHWRYSHLVHHYHEPTVEDVLQEFADEVQRCCDTADTIAKYAAKLRLAGDAE